MTDVNIAVQSGEISEYGVKLAYTGDAKPQLSFSLVQTETDRSGAVHRNYVQVLIVGPRAEALEAHDRVLVTGRLQWKPGRTKDSGKQFVVGYDVELLSRRRLAAAVESAN